jgi:hypothetical protein
VALGLAVAAAGVHWPILHNGFVGFDDPTYVLNVPEVMSGPSWSSVGWAFTSIDGSNYFPVTRLSWMLDAGLYGRNPRGFHATSLALHALNVALFFLALFRLTRALVPSAFVAAVFAVHPLHVESVAWVAARKDLWAGFFFCLTLLFHERRARGTHPLAWSVALALALAAGLLAKPVLVTLPFLLLLLDFWPLGRWRRGRIAGLFREKAALFALVLASSAITLFVQEGAMAPSVLFPLSQRLLSTAVGYVEYVERAIFPHDLAVLYPIARNAVVRFWLGVPALAAVSVIAIHQRDRWPWLFVGWFWFVGMLVPTTGLVQVGTQATADRYVYLPLAGLSICIAWGTRSLLARVPPDALRPAQGLVAVVALAWLTFLTVTTRAQITVWRNSRTLFEHAVAVTENNPGALYRLGLLEQQLGERASAIAHYEQALRLEPSNPTIRGLLEQARGQRRAP